RIIQQACARRGFEPKVAARSGQMDFMIALVAAGLARAFLPRMILEDRPQAGLTHVRLDEPDLRRDLAPVWRRAADASLAARAWLDRVRETHAGRAQPGPRNPGRTGAS